MNGQNVQLIDIVCYVGGFFITQWDGANQNTSKSNRALSTVHECSLTYIYVHVKHFVELPGNK